MNIRTIIWRTSLAAVVLFMCGCTMARKVETFEQLRKASPRTLRAMATDRSIYELTSYTVRDSVLEGSGKRFVDGESAPFTGSLPYRDLVYIQMRTGGFWQTLGAVSLAALAVSYFQGSGEFSGMSIEPMGNSCPYVYAWNGSRYVREGEAFGTSFGRALEGETICMLSGARARDGELLVRLTNERPETHYVNRVRLIAFDVPDGCAAIADEGNRVWPVADARAPLNAPPALRRNDGVRRTSEPDACAQSGYRDVVDLTFARPVAAAGASLIVCAVNTDLVYNAFELTFGTLGDQSLVFLDQVENDPRLVETLRDWIRRCSLSVEVWSGDRWVPAGVIAPEASVAPFSRLVRLDARGVPGDAIHVRLSALAGMWELDSVAIDWSPAAPLDARLLAVRAVTGRDGRDASAAVRETDADYATMLPGDRIDLAFAAVPDAGGRRSAYGLEVSGYLLEWPPAAEGVLIAESVDRVALVNELIRRPEAFLPLVYDHWKRRRGAVAG